MHGTQKPTQSTGRLWTARRRSKTLLAMLSLLAIVAMACGSDTTTATADEGSADPEVETTAEPDAEVEAVPAPDETIVAFVEAFGVADADLAWSFYTPRCQEIISENSFDDYAAFVAQQGVENPGLTPSNISAVVNGNSAEISYDNHDETGRFVESHFSQPWIFADGKWQWDAC